MTNAPKSAKKKPALVLVPREPDEVMRRSGMHALLQCKENERHGAIMSLQDRVARVYRAMLAAAPTNEEKR